MSKCNDNPEGRDKARPEFRIIAAPMAGQYPETPDAYGITVKPVTERFMGDTPVRTMHFILRAVMLVLLKLNIETLPIHPLGSSFLRLLERGIPLRRTLDP